jgi:hypothetical protein
MAGAKPGLGDSVNNAVVEHSNVGLYAAQEEEESLLNIN